MDPKSSSIKVYSYTKNKNLYILDIGAERPSLTFKNEPPYPKDFMGTSAGFGARHIALNGKRLRWKYYTEKSFYNNKDRNYYPESHFFDILGEL